MPCTAWNRSSPATPCYAGSLEDAPIVPLQGHLSMLLMTDEYFDAVTVAGAAGLEGFWKAPAGFGSSLGACSELGPVAYVEADYFGGVGTQSAQVWHRGAVILEPLRVAAGERPPSAGTPGPAHRRVVRMTR